MLGTKLYITAWTVFLGITTFGLILSLIIIWATSDDAFTKTISEHLAYEDGIRVNFTVWLGIFSLTEVILLLPYWSFGLEVEMENDDRAIWAMYVHLTSAVLKILFLWMILILPVNTYESGHIVVVGIVVISSFILSISLLIRRALIDELQVKHGSFYILMNSLHVIFLGISIIVFALVSPGTQRAIAEFIVVMFIILDRIYEIKDFHYVQDI